MTRSPLVRTMPRLVQFASYGAVSAVALSVDFGTLIALKEHAAVNYVVAAAAGMIVGTIVHYCLAKAFVFGEGRLRAKTAEFLVYALLGGVATTLSVAAMVVLTDVGGLDYRASKAGSVFLSFVVGFALRRSLLLIRSKPHGRLERPSHSGRQGRRTASATRVDIEAIKATLRILLRGRVRATRTI